MAIARSIIGPNYDTFFEPAGPGRPARLRIRLKVTLIPLDPTKAWARSYHPAPLPGTPPGLLPPSDLAATSAKVKRGKVQDVNGKFFTCSTWLTADWLEFNRRFKSTVEHAWNNQMMFVPVEFDDPGQSLSDADFGQLIGNPKVPAHVEGTLEVDLQAPGTIGHAVIEVAHLVEPSAPFAIR